MNTETVTLDDLNAALDAAWFAASGAETLAALYPDDAALAAAHDEARAAWHAAYHAAAQATAS
jgi:hypothetical protein